MFLNKMNGKHNVENIQSSNNIYFDVVEARDSSELSSNHEIDDEGKETIKNSQTVIFGKCYVCNDKATGIHYGIASCEACKGFFKRTTQRKEKYRCYFGNACPITPENRNNCKACRFNKCLSAGMSFQGTKLGRIPNSVKPLLNLNNDEENDNSINLIYLNTNNFINSPDWYSNSNLTFNNENFKSNQNYSEFELKKRKFDQDSAYSIDSTDFDESSKQISLYSKLIDINKAFKESNLKIKRLHSNWHISDPKLDISFNLTLSYMSDKIYQIHNETNGRVDNILKKAQILLKSKNRIIMFEGYDATVKECWHGLIEATKMNIKELISFTKQIPGFDKVNKNDLTIILENQLFDFYMVRHSSLFIDGESYVMLPNNIQYTKSWLYNIVGDIMTDALFEFADDFNKLDLTKKEIALLVPFILTFPNKRFQDPGLIANLHDYYFRAILYEFDLNLRSKIFLKDWKNVMDKMFDLNQLNLKYIANLDPKI